MLGDAAGRDGSARLEKVLRDVDPAPARTA